MAGRLAEGLYGTGLIYWDATRDGEGHRNYTVRHRVETLYDDGPREAMLTPGLPTIHTQWNVGNDFDPWAFCLPNMRIIPDPNDAIAGHNRPDAKTAEQTRYRYWVIEQQFTTRPQNDCREESIEDPLLEPPKISGSFTRFTKEVKKDKDGNVIQTSSFEPVEGPEVEFDQNRPTVVIEHNVGSLGLPTFTQLIDTVNDANLWGLSSRRIKLSNVSWSRQLYGVCNFFYTRTFEFEISFNTFDTEPLDIGTKALGEWDKDGVWQTLGGDPNNPKDFKRYRDYPSNEITKVVLDGTGKPLGISGTAFDPVPIPSAPIKYYPESNFLALGIPGFAGLIT